MASSNLVAEIVLVAILAAVALIMLVVSLGRYAAYRAEVRRASEEGTPPPKRPVGLMIIAGLAACIAIALIFAPLSTVSIKIDLPPPASTAP